MPMVEIKSEPSATELRVFAALWLLFWLFLGVVATTNPDVLLIPAVVTAGCFAVSLFLSRDVTGRDRLWGLGFPIGLAAMWALGNAVMPGGGPDAIYPLSLLGAAGAVGMAGLVIALGSRRRGIGLYRVWMLAAMPIGWVLSHAMMMTVFYGVVTPIGLLVRARGRDPMTRRFEPSASTYWVGHETPADAKRYFKQS